jgi:hypothetical protein
LNIWYYLIECSPFRHLLERRAGMEKAVFETDFFAKKSVSKTAFSEGFKTFDTPFKINES